MCFCVCVHVGLHECDTANEGGRRNGWILTVDYEKVPRRQIWGMNALGLQGSPRPFVPNLAKPFPALLPGEAHHHLLF